jgi:hypothetical protein
LIAAYGSAVGAQVRVNPTGVSVNAMDATTVFLSFGGLRNQRPTEALWCGELLTAAPARGLKCDPATLFGRLPLRYDQSRLSAGNFTDVMSIPASVARLAYQAAQRGATSTFFYVRRFESTAGAPDEYVAVTCRLTGGGARSPFSLTDVQLEYETRDAVPFIVAGGAPPPISARISYNGTGRLVGRWEIALPGEEPAAAHDLLTEGSLPPAERASSLLWQSVHVMTLPVRRGARRLTTSGFRRGPATGWKDGFEVWNSNRVLVWLTWRLVCNLQYRIRRVGQESSCRRSPGIDTDHEGCAQDQLEHRRNDAADRTDRRRVVAAHRRGDARGRARLRFL